MKRYIKKLFYSSVMIIASIEISSNTEARVTKEVAEAVLPYLMEVAGIPGDAEDKQNTETVNGNKLWYAKSKIAAILDMIYTDEGQQQMVEWVQQGNFPPKLEKAEFQSVRTYENKTYRDATLASLFPCSTGTFSAFANHESRLGKHLLSTDSTQRLNILKKTFHKNLDAESILSNVNCIHMHDIDIIIAKIVFVLEICDDAAAIANLVFNPREATDFIKRIKDKPSNSEYLCRPVSAIVAKNISEKYEGDCTETLYKHLINIAIQDNEHPNKFYTKKLPNTLSQYYSSNVVPYIELKWVTTYAGETNIVKHGKWKEQLLKFLTKRIISCYQVQPIKTSRSNIEVKITPAIDFSKDNALALEKFLSIGSVQNIAAVLANIANLQTTPDKPAVIIENALNALAQHSNEKKFEVTCVKREAINYPWITDQIIISEKVKEKLKRTITVGICENQSDANYGHSEIISINLVK